MDTLTITDYSKNPIEFTEIPAREKRLLWQEQGLQYTASGYGKRIPTTKQVLDGKRWKRVYCTIYGNTGTCWFLRKGEKIIVS